MARKSTPSAKDDTQPEAAASEDQTQSQAGGLEGAGAAPPVEGEGAPVLPPETGAEAPAPEAPPTPETPPISAPATPPEPEEPAPEEEQEEPEQESQPEAPVDDRVEITSFLNASVRYTGENEHGEDGDVTIAGGNTRRGVKTMITPEQMEYLVGHGVFNIHHENGHLKIKE